MEDIPVIPGTGLIDLNAIQRMIPNDFRETYEEAKRQFNEEFMLTPTEIREVEETGRKNNTTPVFPVAISFTEHKIRSVYGSPFPDELLHLKTVVVCDYCLKFFQGRATWDLHFRTCNGRPPGVEIYKNGKIAVYEVNGNSQKSYCQNLCLIGRLFLESKTVSHDTEHFMFYVLTHETDEGGARFVGYFSREMYWPPAFSMMCLVVLPSHQGKGYGMFLVALSYAMARQQNLQLGPETPLSAEGNKTHKQFWCYEICKFFNSPDVRERIENAQFDLEGFVLKKKTNVLQAHSFSEVHQKTGIRGEDVVNILSELDLIPDLVIDRSVNPVKKQFYIDYEFVEYILNQKEINRRVGREEFDETKLDWHPQQITPQMNGFDTYDRIDQGREPVSDESDEDDNEVEEAEETEDAPTTSSSKIVNQKKNKKKTSRKNKKKSTKSKNKKRK